MKKYSLLVLGLLLSIYVFSQDKYLTIPFVGDDDAMQQIQSEYLNKDFKSILYQPMDDDGYTSILIINYNNQTDYSCIKYDSILSKGILKSDSIFLYKNYKRTGAVNSERFGKRTFVPPLISGGFNRENVVYKDKKTEFYFEYDYNPNLNPTTHKSSPKRAAYRKEWLEIIRRELKDVLE